ncbi:MAG TPA: tyrosine-type recombinase/integrase [Solirubrobacterales bacterium]|jgi:integrase|nr:tyrosine-type recombinase/integrase [Solirubrobacterales bacterium]
MSKENVEIVRRAVAYEYYGVGDRAEAEEIKRAKDAWRAAELEPITLHEGRHTFASLLIDSGANPKAVQEFMGHSKIQTTFDCYGHLFPGSHDEVRERMDAYLLAATEPGCEPEPTA